MALSYFEIGGVILDGSYGYNHRKFRRLRQAVRKNEPLVVADITTGLVLDIVSEVQPVMDAPRSERIVALEEWGKRNRRRMKRLVAPTPLPVPVKVAVAVLPDVAVAYSRATGSYDMRSPEVQRYEESVHWGGSGGMII
jgi:hypothetical protein